MRTISSQLIFVSIYFIAGMLPAVAIMCINYLMDPSTPWANVAVGWMSDSGIPYAGSVLAFCYAVIFWYPAITIAAYMSVTPSEEYE